MLKPSGLVREIVFVPTVFLAVNKINLVIDDAMEPEEEPSEDELTLATEWDSRNFGDKEFLPNGSRYKVKIFNYYNQLKLCNTVHRALC